MLLHDSMLFENTQYKLTKICGFLLNEKSSLERTHYFAKQIFVYLTALSVEEQKHCLIMCLSLENPIYQNSSSQMTEHGCCDLDISVGNECLFGFMTKKIDKQESRTPGNVPTNKMTENSAGSSAILHMQKYKYLCISNIHLDKTDNTYAYRWHIYWAYICICIYKVAEFPAVFSSICILPISVCACTHTSMHGIHRCL